jgi:hypothetical protein
MMELWVEHVRGPADDRMEKIRVPRRVGRAAGEAHHALLLGYDRSSTHLTQIMHHYKIIVDPDSIGSSPDSNNIVVGEVG